MICPYCEQGLILKANLRKNNKLFLVCDECDTVWEDVIKLERVTSFEAFMKKEDVDISWNEVTILEDE